jgi:huntingtin
MGANITDVKLVGKDGQNFFTIRTDNWNEKVGTVSAQEVAVITETDAGLTPITLQKYLSDNGLSSSLDDKVSIRFQTTFLPIEDGTVEFCTDSYSYNTPDPSDPKNLLLLCTTQGLTLHTNKNTYQKLFLHGKDSSGKLINRWLEAEETSYKVGAEQIETDKQVEENIKRGKAASAVIGVKSMGQRFNALLTVQIPLKQKERVRSRGGGGGLECFCDYDSDSVPKGIKAYSAQSAPMAASAYRSLGTTRGVTKGISSAARVSKGSVASEPAIKVDTSVLKRSETEHITITVILYHVVKGGIPTREDVIAAVTELEQLYESCKWSGTLKDISAHNVIPSLVKDEVVQDSYKLLNRTTFPV